MATKNEKRSLLVKIMLIGLISVIPSCMIIPFMTVELKRLGLSETLIGLYTAMPWLGLLTLSPFVTRITKRFGLRKIYIVTGLMNIAHCSVLVLADSFYIFCISNFIFGFVWALRWITTETLIADYAPEDKKGQAMGIYGTLICGFIATGPLLLLVTGVDTHLPLKVALVFFIISWFVTLTLPKLDYMKEEDDLPTGFISFVKANTLLFFAVFIGGIFENGISAPTILYSISLGIEDKFAAIIPAILAGGTFATQYIIGIVTDKYRHKNLFLFMSAILLVFSLLSFISLMEAYFIYVPTFIWGGFGGGIYIMSLIILGYKYTGTQLVAANAYLVIFYTVGSLIGPVIGGATLEFLPQYGFLILLSALSVAVTVASAYKNGSALKKV